MRRFKVRRTLTVTQDFYVWADTEAQAHDVANAADLTAGDTRIDTRRVTRVIEVPPMLTGVQR